MQLLLLPTLLDICLSFAAICPEAHAINFAMVTLCLFTVWQAKLGCANRLLWSLCDKTHMQTQTHIQTQTHND